MIEVKNSLNGEHIRKKWASYPSYKESGVEWLCNVPEQWKISKLKYIAFINNSVLSENTSPDYLLKYVDISGLDSNGNIIDEQEYVFEKAPSRARRLVKSGDTIVSTVRTYLRAIGFIPNPPNNLVVSTGFAVLTPRDGIYPNYLVRLIQSNQFIDAIVTHSQGVSYPAINPSTLAGLSVWVPSLNEQKYIVSFLDSQITKIDALIAKKERLIELLQEKRTAIINQAVTKGLDPNVPIKDSEIEWLGYIPSHWQIMPLKRFAYIRYGLGQPPEDSSGIVPLIRATNINSGIISTEGMVYINPKDVPESRDAVLRNGEIIVVRSGAYTGDSAIIPAKYDGAIAGYDMIVRVNKNLPEFIAIQLLSIGVRNLQFSFYSLRAAQPHLNAEDLGNTLFTIPPVSEQEAIYKFINDKSMKINNIIERIRSCIKLLKEYRAALISAAVTGNIDVRGVA